jgi:glucose/arabinose dehydrogenase
VKLSRTKDDERGLLAVTFSPQFATDRTVYVFYTAPCTRRGWSHVNVLSSFRTDPAGSSVDPASQEVLWQLPQRGASHAGGQMIFERSGRMLVFLGDGLDPRLAQSGKSSFGKVLRFDLGAPASEPSVIASGVRHPWRVTTGRPHRAHLFRRAQLHEPVSGGQSPD